MKNRTINSNGVTMQEITIEAHGKGGVTGIKCVKRLTAHIESFKTAKTPQEVYDRFMTVCGYCTCCKDAGFLDAEGANEIMQIASVLAGVEQERAEKQEKQGIIRCFERGGQ